ncbi:MotA/TolQ/ExbB proton channel family protein [bacterium]|nr:MotA/TolQ/ExbB proton channel family protein [bacterium]
MLWDNTLRELFVKGGLCMGPLLFCSVIGLAIILERSAFFVRRPLRYEEFLAAVLGRLRTGDREGARTICRGVRHPVAHIVHVYLDNADEPNALREDILRREGSLQMELVERRLRGLSTLAHLTPLIGLLGTVTGLVSAFHQIELLGGTVRADNLSGGIWESLMTTVFGLVIAIPCMAAYHGFENKADAIARRMQFALSELNEFFGKRVGVTPMKPPADEPPSAVT